MYDNKINDSPLVHLLVYKVCTNPLKRLFVSFFEIILYIVQLVL